MVRVDYCISSDKNVVGQSQSFYLTSSPYFVPSENYYNHCIIVTLGLPTHGSSQCFPKCCPRKDVNKHIYTAVSDGHC